ncbi:MAG: glycosyltransferase family 39 protein [Eubacterium sp.]|nr:glycosyltransferase family 39 protein [Eubacterium sp.]
MKRSDFFKNHKLPVWFLFAGGIALRYAYILFTNIYTRQHDVGDFTSHTGGHYDYIDYIMNQGLLPDFDPSMVSQFAHPPLHHLLCAWWMKFMTGVLGVDFGTAAESLQYLTCLYSIGLMYVCYRIFLYLKLEGIPLYIATAVVCFHPAFILLSGSVNNDMLSVLLMAITLLFALKWYRDRRMRDLIVSAVTVGLAMMTKLSAVMVAAPIAFLMLVALIRCIREHKLKQIIIQLGTYAAISFPIGLWFPVYNAIRWDMPLFFVYPLSERIPQYLGDRSFLTRIFDFSPYQFQSVYEQWVTLEEPGLTPYSEFNPLIAALKNSMFGERINYYTFQEAPAMHIVTAALFISGAVLAFAAFIFMLHNLIKDRGELHFERMAIGVFFIAMMLGYYSAAKQYPFECTMDFRYIPLTVLCGACFLGLGAKRLLVPEPERFRRVRRGGVILMGVTTALFALLSSAMYVGLFSLTKK